MPPVDYPGMKVPDYLSYHPAMTSTGEKSGGSQADFESLINLILQAVSPESWKRNSGRGTIEPFEGNLSLVIRQKEGVHEEISDLLTQLRKMQDLQLEIETYFIRMPDQLMKTGGFEVDPQQGFALLDSTDAQVLVKLAQRSKNAEVLASPKLRLFNGQIGTVTQGDQEKGTLLSMGVQGVITEDRKRVRVALSLDKRFMPVAMVSAPDGGAILFDVSRKLQGNDDDRPIYALVCPKILILRTDEERRALVAPIATLRDEEGPVVSYSQLMLQALAKVYARDISVEEIEQLMERGDSLERVMVSKGCSLELRAKMLECVKQWCELQNASESEVQAVFKRLDSYFATAQVEGTRKLTDLRLLSDLMLLRAHELPVEEAPRFMQHAYSLRYSESSTQASAYRIGRRDVLAIHIEGVVPKDANAAPPVNDPPVEMPDMPKTVGYPFAVRDDGTISLPQMPPIYVSSLSLPEAEEMLRIVYSEMQKEVGSDDIISVGLIKPRANWACFGKAYPVEDLLVMTPLDTGGRTADFNPLMTRLQETCKPESWQINGGPGSLNPFEGNLNLIIFQTEEVHEKIAELLAKLRKE